MRLLQGYISGRMLVLVLVVVVVMGCFLPVRAEKVTVTDNTTTTTTEFQVSSELHGSVTKTSGTLSAEVTKINTKPKPVPLVTAEENRIKKALAALGVIFSLFALWGIVKNMIVAVQTLGKEGMTPKFISQLIVAVTLLVILLYSMNVLFAGVGIGSGDVFG